VYFESPKRCLHIVQIIEKSMSLLMLMKILLAHYLQTRQFDRSISNGMAALSREDIMPQSLADAAARVPRINATNIR